MKRVLIAFIIIFAILSGVPEAFRQYRSMRDTGADWLRTMMFEGFMNSAEGATVRPSRQRCEPTLSAARQSADDGSNDLQLIGGINLGASNYVVK
jgi:hypothetical protein